MCQPLLSLCYHIELNFDKFLLLPLNWNGIFNSRMYLFYQILHIFWCNSSALSFSATLSNQYVFMFSFMWQGVLLFGTVFWNGPYVPSLKALILFTLLFECKMSFLEVTFWCLGLSLGEKRKYLEGIVRKVWFGRFLKGIKRK